VASTPWVSQKNVNFNCFYWFVLHILCPVDILTEICMGFVPQRVWVIGMRDIWVVRAMG
jgi:hypothetical protein